MVEGTAGNTGLFLVILYLFVIDIKLLLDSMFLNLFSVEFFSIQNPAY